MKRILKSRAVAAILTLIMVMGMSSMAFASDSDPNLTAMDGVFTYTTGTNELSLSDGAGRDFELLVGPADQSWMFTGFSTQEAAENVTWSIVGSSMSGVTLSEAMALDLGDGQFVSYMAVNVAANAEAGSASILAKNNENGSFVNFTILVNDTDASDAVVMNQTPVNTKFEVCVPDSDVVKAGSGMVLANNYYSDRSFPTVADTMLSMLLSGTVEGYNNQWGYVESLTVDGTLYAPSYPSGWQYRIYHQTGETATEITYTMSEISAVAGYDDVKLQDGDLVQWRVGTYDNTNLFPETITRAVIQ